ncbi:MAG: hypothetical protein RIG68_26595 [Imperialibacter sp.]|uniref:hypothetical protein n=1 Tax=Imperialibacter sp. TaxID=2038411 RepID=UPI0032ED780D
MKAYYLFILLFFFQDNFTEFLGLFPKAKMDENGSLLTRALNSKDNSDLLKQYETIPDAHSFSYLCDGDSSKFQYEYGLYDMDKGEEVGIVKESYKHAAIASISARNFDMVLFSKFDSDNERYYIRSFDKKGTRIAELMINEEVRVGTGASLVRFSFSLINENRINVFTYCDVKNPNREEEKTLRTKVVVEDYSIDSLGRFTKVAMDSVFLVKPKGAYANFDSEPEVDDPIYKYWTLW